MTTQCYQPWESRVCVCACRKTQCLHETFFDLLNLFRPFWEMFRKRHDNTVIHPSSHGQLYVACSRVGNPTNTYIPAPEGKTKNFSDISNRRWHSNFVTCLCFPINCRTRHCIHSRCCLLLARVLLRKYWTLSYVTWRIFHSDTFPQFIPSPFFCYIIHKIAIRFRHGHHGQRRVPLLVAHKGETAAVNNVDY